MNFAEMERKLTDAEEAASWHPIDAGMPDALSLREQRFLLDIAKNAHRIMMSPLPCDVQLLDDRTMIVYGLPTMTLLRAIANRRKKVSS